MLNSKQVLSLVVAFQLAGVPSASARVFDCIPKMASQYLLKRSRNKAVISAAEQNLVNQTKEKIVQSADAEQISKVVRGMSLDLAEFKANLVREGLETKLISLNEEIEELSRCGSNGQCRVVQAKKGLALVNALRKVIWSSMFAEKRAENLLKTQIESMADDMGGPIYEAMIRDGIYGKPEAEKWVIPDPRVLPALIKKEFARESVRESYRKNLLHWILPGQLAGQIVHLGTHFTLWGLVPSLWVYMQTPIITVIQRALGASKTPEQVRPITTFDDTLAALPQFLHGKAGYKTDFKNKFRTLFAVIALEIPISVVCRALNSFIPGAGFLPQGAHEWELFAGMQGATILTLYTFFSFRAAAWDELAYLNILKNLQRGRKNTFREKLFISLKNRGELSATLSLDQFIGYLNEDSVGESQNHLKQYEPVFLEANKEDKRYDADVALSYQALLQGERNENIYRGINEVGSGAFLFVLVDYIGLHFETWYTWVAMHL